jgi:CubicO group peptidase (beta-lactamase class C family)
MSLVMTHTIRARVVFVLCLLLLCPAPRVSAQNAAAAVEVPAEKIRQIEALISAEMARQKILGLSVALVTERRLSWSNGYGLGWGVNTRNGLRTIGHSGAQQRVSTHIHLQPDQGLAVVLMANIEDVRLGDLALQISDVLLK